MIFAVMLDDDDDDSLFFSLPSSINEILIDERNAGRLGLEDRK